MKVSKIILGLVFLFSLTANFFGQEIDFEGNWFREIKGYDDFYTSYDFDRYTKDDVVNAKKRFELIKQLPPKDEWEGVYSNNVEIGARELHWNSTGGFVDYYVYHTLSSLDYGSASDKPDSVKLVSEKSPDSKRKSYFSTNLIKVKFGDKHFLVPEMGIQDFVESAIGLSTNSSDFNYYLWKLNEIDNKVFGLPILPKKYRHLLRSPIKTKITGIGNRQIYQDKFDKNTINYEEIHHFVILGAGKKKIKAGMNFFVEDLGEWIEITRVLSNSSIGKIRRDLNNQRKEVCRNMEQNQGDIIPCQKIKVGMEIKTKVSENFF